MHPKQSVPYAFSFSPEVVLIQLRFLILIRTEVTTVHKSLFFSINLCHTYSLGTAGGIIQFKDLETMPAFIGCTTVQPGSDFL